MEAGTNKRDSIELDGLSQGQKIRVIAAKLCLDYYSTDVLCKNGAMPWYSKLEPDCTIRERISEMAHFIETGEFFNK